MHVNCAATGVCDERRFARRRNAVSRGLRVGMTEIERDANLIHFCNRFAPKFGQSFCLAIEASDSEWATPIIRKLHHPHAEMTKHFNALDFVFEHGHSFERIDDAEFSL